MRHDEALERLPELLFIRSAGRDESRLREHVAGCDECRTRLAAMTDIEHALRTAGADGPRDALRARVLSIPHEQATVRRRPPAGMLVGIACALLVGVLAALAAWTQEGGAPQRFSRGQAIALTSADTTVTARLVLGAPEGPNQPLRLVAHGLSPTGAPFYTLWLSGPSGPVSAGTFRPDPDGDCVVEGVVPHDAWTHATITEANARPGSTRTVAGGDL